MATIGPARNGRPERAARSRRTVSGGGRIRDVVPAQGRGALLGAAKATEPTERRLYWAYGSNVNVSQMRARCPGAMAHGPLILHSTVLRFRRVADVVAHETAECPGGLWWISPEDERALDRYEGVKSKVYEKRSLRVEIDGMAVDCLYYKMLAREIMSPSDGYLQIIALGYRDFGLDTEPLEAAVRHAWSHKARRRRTTPQPPNRG